MEIGLYNIINNPLPVLNNLNYFKVKETDFLEDDKIVQIVNKYLKMDRLASEHVYVLGLTYSLLPKGFLQVSVGKSDSCEVDLKSLATGILLMGSEQFICFHNHPGGERKISNADLKITERYREIGELLEIKFLKHIMITKDYYTYCSLKEKTTVFGREV